MEYTILRSPHDMVVYTRIFLYLDGNDEIYINPYYFLILEDSLCR